MKPAVQVLSVVRVFPSPQRSSVSTVERDVYEELLTQQEIQDCTDLVNGERWGIVYMTLIHLNSTKHPTVKPRHILCIPHVVILIIHARFLIKDKIKYLRSNIFYTSF